MAATERVPVLMTPTEKKQILAKAKKAGISTSEYMRRAAAGYTSTEDDRALEAMIDEMNKSTERASSAIDDTLTFVEESNERIARMEEKARSEAA